MRWHSDSMIGPYNESERQKSLLHLRWSDFPCQFQSIEEPGHVFPVSLPGSVSKFTSGVFRINYDSSQISFFQVHLTPGGQLEMISVLKVTIAHEHFDRIVQDEVLTQVSG